MNKKRFLTIAAETILVLLVFSNLSSYSIGYSYAAKKNTSAQNENIPPPGIPPLPTPPVRNENIPPPGIPPLPTPPVRNENTPGTLTVTTEVSGGNKSPSDFTITVSGNNPKPDSFPGSSSGTSVTLLAGRYSVSSSTIDGYTTSYSSGCSGTASGGQVKCTVTNRYTGPPSPPGATTFLSVITNVDNTNGGTKKPSDFTITVSGNNPKPDSFPGSSSGTSVTLLAGRYSVSSSTIDGYTTSYSSGCSGTASGGQVKCTVTNRYTGPPSPPRATTTPPPFTDTQTAKLGKSLFSSDALRPLIDVGPSSNITGGHVSLSSPTGSSDHLKLIAAEITDGGVQHAVAVNLTKTTDITSTGQSLYHSDLRSPFSGINPFTGAQDRVTHFTDLLLWNNGTSAIQFAGNDTIAMKAIFEQPQFVTPSITFAGQTSSPAANLGLLQLDSSAGGSSVLSSLGLMPLIDVGPSSNITGGHVSLSSPTGSSDHLKLIAAEITDGGVQHAVAVNLTKTTDITSTGQSLYHSDLRSPFSGINPFTEAQDRVTHFTDLLLWNNGTSSIVFSGDDYLTTEIIYLAR